MARKQLWRRNETAVRNDWGSWLVVSIRGKIPFWGELLPEDGTFVYIIHGGKPWKCWNVGNALCHDITVELLRSDWNPNCDDDLMIDCRFSFPYLESGE